MKCKICKKNDALFEVDIAGGESGSAMCVVCFRKYISQNADMVACVHVASGVHRFAGEICCPRCGRILTEILMRGVVGCEYCYNYFEGDISAALEKNGYATQYHGRSQKKADIFANIEDAENRCRENLRDALSNHDYEKAAQLRDQLAGLSAIRENQIE